MIPPPAHLLRLRARRLRAAFLLLSGLAGSLVTSHAATVSLRPVKDTTIYSDSSSNLSNGSGSFLFAGTSGQRRVLRSLVAFNLAGQIPAGATINSVALTLGINTPIDHAAVLQLRRVLADWGEAGSLAPMGGGGGAPALPGDATWAARFFGTAAWATPGGDFAPTVSASQSVSGRSGTVTLTSAGLVADVQAWLNAPTSNFGWILMAQNEAGAAVRFASREGAPAPALVIDFTVGSSNTPPVILAQPASQTVAAGANVAFSVTTSGVPAPTLQWRKNGVAISGATGATLALTAVTPADAGAYTVVATNVAGSETSAAANLVVTGSPPGESRLSNLSVRAAMAAEQTLIVGFSVSGGARSILIRGVGPTLGSFGLTGTMVDPRLELYNGGTLVAQSDDWGNSAALSTAFSSVGAFALLANSRDAALLQSIDGTRSVHLKGTGPGVALVELYDTGTGFSPRLVNVSARNQVGTGDNILIFGFFIAGEGTKRVLIRAIGPRLADLGVTGVLADPRFDVFRSGSAAAVAGNDNWDASLAATFSAVGAFSLNAGSRDAALVVALTPGGYTVQVSGVNNTTGEALVEIYEVP